MLNFLFQIFVIIPLVTHITHHRFSTKAIKLLACLGIIAVFLSIQMAIFFTKEKKESIYNIMGITRDTPSSKVRKAFRNASLKYHPDKNKSPEALTIYHSLNDIVDILKDEDKKEFYDYYGVKQYDEVKKPTAMGSSDEEYKFQLFFQRFIFSMGSIPIYVAWLFIPIAYLDKTKRRTKFFLLIFVVAMGALELGFMIKYIPDPLAEAIKIITPQTWTHKDLFKILHISLPYLIDFLIVYFDIYILKVHEKKETDEERFKNNIKAQNKFCMKMVKSQEELIKYIGDITEPTEKISRKIVKMNKKIYKQMKTILSVEEENEKIEGKWTWGKIISAGFFILFVIKSTT